MVMPYGNFDNLSGTEYVAISMYVVILIYIMLIINNKLLITIIIIPSLSSFFSSIFSLHPTATTFPLYHLYPPSHLPTTLYLPSFYHNFFFISPHLFPPFVHLIPTPSPHLSPPSYSYHYLIER